MKRDEEHARDKRATKGGREGDREAGPEGEGGGEKDESRKDGTERGRQEKE